MVKKLSLVLVVLCLVANLSHAVMVDTRSSGSTVTFSTVVRVVTFNSVTNHLYFRNQSPTSDCYVILRTNMGVAQNDATLILPAYGTQTPNTVMLDFATNSLGFISATQTPASSVGTKVDYTVTGDRGDL